MPSLIDSLKIRYDAVFASDSDSLFYQNLHHYFDLVVKTPTLSVLLVESQKEYAEKHGAIWGREKSKTDEEADDKSERTLRMERFNLYALAATIMVRIYVRIEDYKNSLHEPEIDQDPAAVLMMRGIKNINPKYAKINPFKWGHKNLKGYSWWYEGKRPYYEKELRQFHLALLDAMEASEKSDAPKHDVSFNPDTGTLTAHGMSAAFNLKSQPYRVLAALWQSKNHQATLDELLRAMRPNSGKEIKASKPELYKVIRNIRRALNILPKREGSTPDILKNIPRYGYRLVLSQETKPEQT